MTKTYKLALLAALGLASVSAQAQNYVAGDLLVGIYNSASANTLVVDLGSASSITGQTYQQWNLSADLTAAGISFASGTSSFGVVGATGSVNGSTAYSTGVGASTFSAADVAGIYSSTATIGQYGTIPSGPGGYSVVAVGDPNGTDWYTQTLKTPPTSGTLIATVLGTGINSAVGTSDVLYGSTGSFTHGRPPVTTPGSEATYLAFDLTPNGTLTYGTAAVPEPSTYGLIAGAGLLALSLRNKFVRKQA